MLRYDRLPEPGLLGRLLGVLGWAQPRAGQGWVEEYGSPRDPEQFRALRAYSPYHNIRDGGHYPAVLLVAGDEDAVVAPAHSLKFAAALQHAQDGPAPVLLRALKGADHRGPRTVEAVIDKAADQLAFLVKSLKVRLPEDERAGR
jgi:prolyl oligopeptidase